MDRTQLEREEVFEKGQVLTNVVPTHLNYRYHRISHSTGQQTYEGSPSWNELPHYIIIVKL